MNQKNRQVVEEFRANAGVVLVTPPHGPILLLHSIGAKSGKECLTPLIYRRDGDRPLEIPAGAVVVPGARAAAGAAAARWGISLYAPVIVKYRDAKTDAATVLEEYLR